MDANESIVACVAPFLRRNEVQKAIFTAFTPDNERRETLEELQPSTAYTPRFSGVPETPGIVLQEPGSSEDEGKLITDVVDVVETIGRASVASQTRASTLVPRPPKLCIRSQKDVHRPIVYSDTESVVMAIDIVGLDRIVAAIMKKKGNGWSEAIHGIAGRYICQIVDIVESFGGEIVKFMGDLIFVKWDLAENPNVRQRETVEAITCGVQLLTELADYTVEHHGPSSSLPTVQNTMTSSETGNNAALLEYAGVGTAIFDPVLSASSAPTTITLRMKLGLIVGTVSNVLLGTWERMDFSLYGALIDDLSDILLSCPIGKSNANT
ncbi:hypothetical protein HDU67_009982 [Dinochytrium kinnereticum]|nr:hypothetical protein HDU67_009982 [Dinochytrium kinnereticum]